MDGNIDPAVLASLPPSMQLDLLVQVTNKIDSMSSQHVEFHECSNYLIMSLFVDERKIDGRKPAKVPKGQEGESHKLLTHSYSIMYLNLSFVGRHEMLTMEVVIFFL